MAKNQPRDSKMLYTSEEYISKFPDWHLDRAPGKTSDVLPFVLPIVSTSKKGEIKIADVGAGVGGVLNLIVKGIEAEHPQIRVLPSAFEISSHAVEVGTELYPNISFIQRSISEQDGPFDILMFIDVLEHIENPWQILREASMVADYMIIRQPLLENFSTFRHKNYEKQRVTFGHISYFNYYSFLDMATACGWKQHATKLLPFWELGTSTMKSSRVRKLLVRLSPKFSSYFLAPFYLVGSFEKIS